MLVFITHDGFFLWDYFKQLLAVLLSVFYSFLHELDTESEAKDATDPEEFPDFAFIRRYSLLSVTLPHLIVSEFITSNVIQNMPIFRESDLTCKFFVNVMLVDFIFLKKE